ncbi:TonB C-terminal domain-containing protein [Pseudemcibacter aquimaris]|uniref:TonB C-terminal domain-containing protein n=1 Tax=Pseudemcibacter aquimaris TaxID=2857064 RepID=UPI0020114B82|nr:TonB C-terminal domain-containing protein [Pseudemcibacter aquimaris]MCC3862186.1 TonB C-terminal domain-containing protein [Pseudemcibacter aquimaris]WDU58939.1 TonB C-terminal domain-containing protein [Pseudemcibacter aquimaris]
MKNALYISGGSHVALLLIATVGIPFFSTPRDVEMVIIPVEMVEIAKETATQEIAKRVEPKDKPAPPDRPRRAAELPPPPPKMASTMPLMDQPKDKPAPKPKPEVRAEAPTVSPRSRPRPPSRMTSDRMAALLNKIPETQSVTERLTERFGEREQKATSLDVRRQTMSIVAAIQKKIYGCWNPPSGAFEAGTLKVTVFFSLSRDGSIMGQPRIDDYVRMSGPQRTAADSARRAVLSCAPFSDLELPSDMYDYWRDIKMNFDPSAMIS